MPKKALYSGLTQQASSQPLEQTHSMPTTTNSILTARFFTKRSTKFTFIEGDGIFSGLPLKLKPPRPFATSFRN